MPVMPGRDQPPNPCQAPPCVPGPPALPALPRSLRVTPRLLRTPLHEYLPFLLLQLLLVELNRIG